MFYHVTNIKNYHVALFSVLFGSLRLAFFLLNLSKKNKLLGSLRAALL